ncbi:nucleotide-diphospho-sugar transferase [Piromyces finnis]|uniref:Translation initiation factor eIF2B subunit gamma n=1 Tax=Piromyces finnis TaxID=1754191 RepID=A0A1Y1VM85_9FUNG|nr:nucleotide-diphospho-sugar transferase [Piromyces finnis]|eukprot:ORX60033.1 nucleotide-diphospho-sugar transferase [Piromyces finnis]
MYPLTEENSLPKALLPVANKPLLYYQLQWLTKAGIQDVIVTCHKDIAQKINVYLNSEYDVFNEIKVEVVAINDYVGTADALRYLKEKDKLKQMDLVVISCDLVTDMPPHHILDVHRVVNPSMTALYYEDPKADAEKTTKEMDSPDYIGIDPNRSQLVYVASKTDYSSELPFRMSLLQKFPVINFYTQLRDAHLYIFKQWVFDMLLQKKNISSLRSELVPLLVKCQSASSEWLEKEGIDKFIQSSSPIASSAPTTPLSPNNTSHDETKNTPICTAIVCNASYCSRANTLPTYAEINRYMTRQSTEQRIPDSAEVSPKTQVGPDSLVGDSSKIGERCSIKKSVIGSHCVIGRNVKIIGSVIMDYIVIEDNVKLENCIVCNNGKVLEKCHLINCEVAANFVVPKNTQTKNEQFVEFRELDKDF